MAVTGLAWGQAENPVPGPDRVPVRQQAWQAIGPSFVDLRLAGPAGDGVHDVAFSTDGNHLYALTARGKVWVTPDLGETWEPAPALPDARKSARGAASQQWAPPPEDAGAVIEPHPYDARYVYALGRQLYRSAESGQDWVNLTAHGPFSIIGEWQRAIAFSPRDSALLVVANSRGLWRSVDGGLSWSDLNRNFPNLPPARLLEAGPEAGAPRAFLQGVGAVELDAAGAWRGAPDERVARWLSAVTTLPSDDQRRLAPWPLDLPPGWAASYRVWRQGVTVTGDLTSCASGPCEAPDRHFISAFGAGGAGAAYYAGTTDGHLWVSLDAGESWRPAMQGFSAAGNPVNAIFVDPRNGQLAIAVAGGRGAAHVFRTTNGGIFWDDLTANLPDEPARAVAVNPETGSLYIATESGVFYTRGDLRNPGPATAWTRLGGSLPAGPIEDLRLDSRTGALYAAAAGHGVFRTSVPDIADALRVLNAADWSLRPAAPGGLLTVVGAPVQAARAGSLRAPVLASRQGESQIQVPFEAAGSRLDLALETTRGSHRVGVPLEEVSPAIFIDAAGAPLLLDAGGGAMLDASRPARAASQVLVLTTGLGRVRPDWPTGLAAPLQDPPATVVPVAAYLDGAPLRVVAATLAGGYIGVYVVQIELPAVLNSGTGELAIGAGGKLSNKVRIFLEP